MRLDKVKPSTNFVDNTNPTQVQVYLDNITRALDPVTAYRNVRQELLKKGYIDVPGADQMAANAEKRVQNRARDRDELLARGMTLEDAEAVLNRLPFR